MNTSKENLLTALTATLLAPPFVIKVNDERVNALQTVINANLPAIASKLTDTTRSLLPSLRGGAMFDTLSGDIVIHIPAFTRASKSLYNVSDDTNKVAAHDATFKLPSYDVETVRYFALALQGLMIQPDWSQSLTPEHNNACKLSELVDTVIPVLQGKVATSYTTTQVVDYNAVVRNFGLSGFNLPCVTWENYYKGDNEKGIIGITAVLELTDDNIDVVNASCDKIESLCTASKKKNEPNVFHCVTDDGRKWEIVQSAKTERVGRGSKDIAYRYQFRVTKA